MEKSKVDINQDEASLIIERSQGDIEQLKLEREKLLQKIKETAKTRSMNPVISDAEKEKNKKRLEELSEDLLEKSKEIEEKIKILQQDKN